MQQERFFNNAGPNKPDINYTLPPLERLDLAEIEHYIAQQRYFVLHAPRQTGKTTTLLALMDYLNQQGTYQCLYVNIEAAQAMREDVTRAMRVIMGRIVSNAEGYLNNKQLQAIRAEIDAAGDLDAGVEHLLNQWAKQSAKPIVLLIDEVDALVGDTLISLLRQIRAGYAQRPAEFPQSVILCGVRDVRDYRIHSSHSKEIITGGSAFNIKAKSLRMGNFNATESRTLLLQHTQETGQVFTEAALQQFWELTQGQPWLLNALAYQVTFEMKQNRDRSRVIDLDAVNEAKEALILRRDTHLDQLTDKLKEPRVRRVIAPLLMSEDLEDSLEDDVQYVFDLGLIARDKIHGIYLANPIYREIIPRQLTYVQQLNFEASFQSAWYIQPDGRLNMPKLLSAFQEFFREHSEHWIERFDYKEAGPQLLLQAFLQRIVNGGGRIEREYGLGRLRTDLLILWFYGGHFDASTSSAQCKLSDRQTQKIVLELKILRGSLEKTIEQGLMQTWEYCDRCAGEQAHLLIFDRSEKSWEEKIFQRENPYKNIRISIWGM